MAQILPGQVDCGVGTGFPGLRAGECGQQVCAPGHRNCRLALCDDKVCLSAGLGLLRTDRGGAIALCIAGRDSAGGNQCGIAAIIGRGVRGRRFAGADCGRRCGNLGAGQCLFIALARQRGTGGGDRGLRIVKIGASGGAAGGKFLCIDAQQWLACQNLLIFAHQHRADKAFHARCHGGRIRGKIGIVGGLAGWFGQDPRGAQARHDQRGARGNRGTARAPARRCGGIQSRNCGGLGH